MSDTFFLVFGIIVASLGLFLIILKIKDIIVCNKKIQATVTGHKTEKTMIRGSTIYHYRPKFTYTADEKQYHGEAPYTSRKKEKYPIDETLEIYINPKNPEDYRFGGRIGMFLAGLVILCIGLLFVVLYFI